jgi:hypothetical protein
VAGHIDIVCNLFDPKAVRLGQTGLDDNFKAQVRLDRRYWAACRSAPTCARWIAPGSSVRC